MYGTDEVTRMATDSDALERIVMHAFRMPLPLRKAFLLCDVQGFAVTRAATILGVSVEAVKARLERARRELSVRLAAAPSNAAGDILPF